jgi:hypothetical protein
MWLWSQYNAYRNEQREQRRRNKNTDQSNAWTRYNLSSSGNIIINNNKTNGRQYQRCQHQQQYRIVARSIFSRSLWKLIIFISLLVPVIYVKGFAEVVETIRIFHPLRCKSFQTNDSVVSVKTGYPVKVFANKGRHGISMFMNDQINDDDEDVININEYIADEVDDDDDDEDDSILGEVLDTAGIVLDDLNWRVEKLRLEEQNTKRFLKSRPRFLPYDECCKWVQALSRWKTEDDWNEWINMGEKRNAYIPVRVLSYVYVSVVVIIIHILCSCSITDTNLSHNIFCCCIVLIVRYNSNRVVRMNIMDVLVNG